ncbi:hypothetical protein D8B26_002407 [Coccidioides posadasii str. Silveira]|uniref:Stress response RCI peptide n=2 Tax=Coccidioides posadasii TaxID=199306 RepID=E9DHL1_COCPS|nr:hypothetical protein CPC735_055810 [Coccidioides posadasii C735 delta SOWgp]EER24211.1 hypothetical protein CPC735_055810 [Coccidioides posadasii C735 delta SOWgp]EFW14236.1 stress response RCI peptide [Coccidioides posadasii str. Silveira]QVM07715.1 hypothetical protein D8B26_002407 [Coccidioides posadasii str. Silveira]|eukprot:XP_003066356.1 hypothetical protein CPC735_055810 [Coccidioides posadasii C735 delta SOWgp]
MCSPDLFLGLLAVLFPPVAVWIKVGICSADSIINIALCCLGYVPGLLHAWYIILKYPEPYDEYPDGYQPIVGSGTHHDPENGSVTYYYVAHHHRDNNRSPHNHISPQRSYGATQQNAPGVPPPSTKPAPPVPPQHPSQQNEPARGESSGQGSSSRPHDGSRPPPTYAEAVKGDYKIQS